MYMQLHSVIPCQTALNECGGLRVHRAKSYFYAWAVAIYLLAFPLLPAEATTPTEVFQAVSNVTAEIRLLHDANFTSAKNGAPSIHTENRKPRHVLQLARTVLMKANNLALINGGAMVPVLAMPAREITPGDVLAAVQLTTKVIEGLKPIFSISHKAEPVVANGKKTPSEVYAALYNLSEMIDELGIPATVPNDVHQIAETILLEVTAMARRHDVPVPSRKVASSGKTPKEVYERSFEIVGAFNRLIAKRPELAPKGGLTVPYRHSGAIKPAHVRYALNDLLAEVASMRVAMGDKSEVQLAPLVPGTTPSTVYDRITETLAIIEALTSHA